MVGPVEGQLGLEQVDLVTLDLAAHGEGHQAAQPVGVGGWGRSAPGVPMPGQGIGGQAPGLDHLVG